MSDKVTVKVSYEYFTEKTNEPKLSKPFEIKLIISEDINEIIVNINKLCKYKKQEDRTYYRLFNLETGLFLDLDAISELFDLALFLFLPFNHFFTLSETLELYDFEIINKYGIFYMVI